MLNPKTIHGYLITTDSRAKVYVTAESAPALEAAFRAKQKCYDDLMKYAVSNKAHTRRAMGALKAAREKVKTAATAHLRCGTAVRVDEVTDPSRLDLSKLAPAKPASEAAQKATVRKVGGLRGDAMAIPMDIDGPAGRYVM
jgi:hypothetical protein